MAPRAAPGAHRASIGDVAIEAERHQAMSTAEPRERLFELTGVRAGHEGRKVISRRILHALQVRAHGGLSERARAKLEELARPFRGRADAPPPKKPKAQERRDPRLPPVGTKLSKRYKGREYEVTVLTDGFECNGTIYESLSAAAVAIARSKTNGFAFFGLSKPKQRSNRG